MIRRIFPALLLILQPTVTTAEEELTPVLNTLLNARCADCHSGDDAPGKLQLDTVTADQLLQNPDLLQELMNVIDTGAMPPETEEALPLNQRKQATADLFSMLIRAKHPPQETAALWRLNRFQYNNTVQDLFQLNRQVLALPEKLMTRYGNWLEPSPNTAATRKLPDVVEARSHTLKPAAGLQGVRPFPRDLQAEHGFDNQADQLTLSPLLLDAFLRLSYSIVDSPDFNPETAGIWPQLFANPVIPEESTAVQAAEIRATTAHERLQWFLPRMFRRPVDTETLRRYADYASGRLTAGDDLTAAMKKTVAAAMSSPLFLFRSHSESPELADYTMATRLSYFLWGSTPDTELLQLAADGELRKPEVLRQQVRRMMNDARIERFLDSFPAQWLHLENAVVATPDPALSPWFRVDSSQPASLQMILEPLLLFEAMFLENHPFRELVNPAFSYRSEFLQSWYETPLTPEPVDEQQMLADNSEKDKTRRRLATLIADHEAQLKQLQQPILERLQLAAKNQTQPAEGIRNLEPWAAWEFDENLSESLRGLDLTAHGEVTFQDGRVVLNKSYLQSGPLDLDLKAKSLEVRFILRNPDQRGGGLMGTQGPGDFFDTIVIGERQPRHWISGSNGFARTLDFPNSIPETEIEESVHLVMVYEEDGTTRLYRNGVPYGDSFNKGRAVFPAQKTSVLFGLRHLPAGGNRHLAVEIDQARLYTRALNQDEVRAAFEDRTIVIGEAAMLAAMSEEQRARHAELVAATAGIRTKLRDVPPNVNLQDVKAQNQQRFADELRRQMNTWTFRRVAQQDRRYGGIITNAAMLSMTSGPKRTHPVARGVWITEVIFNDPPKPPPNDVPPLDEDAADPNLTIREQFAAHRENPSCAGCHTRLDPLGFALENYDVVGRWRDRYRNGRDVDTTGNLLRQHPFTGIREFRSALQTEEPRIVRAFTEHLLRFALARPLTPADTTTVQKLLQRTIADNHGLRTLVTEVAMTAATEVLEQPVVGD